MPVYISMLFYITIFVYNEMKAKRHFKGKVFKKNSVLHAEWNRRRQYNLYTLRTKLGSFPKVVLEGYEEVLNCKMQRV